MRSHVRDRLQKSADYHKAVAKFHDIAADPPEEGKEAPSEERVEATSALSETHQLAAEMLQEVLDAAPTEPAIASARRSLPVRERVRVRNGIVLSDGGTARR